MKLLRSQKNEIYAIIEKESKLDPNQFEFEEIQSKFDSIPIATSLKFKASDYFFTFETNQNKPFAVFSPDKEKFLGMEFPGTWSGEIQNFRNWLQYLEREVTTVDRWKLLEEEMSHINFEFNSEEGHFTIQEYELLSTKLDELKSKIGALEIPAEQIEKFQKSLDYLKIQAKKLNKTDWKNLFIGTIINLVIQFAFAPEKATALWDIIKQTFSTFLLTN